MLHPTPFAANMSHGTTAAVRIYYDFETTGFRPHGRIVQFGALADDGRCFDQLVNPGIPIPRAASEVHHIVDELVQAEPPFQEAWVRFLKFVDDVRAGEPVLLIGWNSWSYDDRVLHDELSRCDLDPTAIGDRVVWTADGMRAMHAAIKAGRYTKPSSGARLGQVYADLVGEELVDAHDAIADCKAVRAVLPHFEKYLTCCTFSDIGKGVAARVQRPAPSRLDVTVPSEAAEAADAVAAETAAVDAAAANANSAAAVEPYAKLRRARSYSTRCDCGRIHSTFFRCTCSLAEFPHIIANRC